MNRETVDLLEQLYYATSQLKEAQAEVDRLTEEIAQAYHTNATEQWDRVKNEK